VVAEHRRPRRRRPPTILASKNLIDKAVYHGARSLDRGLRGAGGGRLGNDPRGRLPVREQPPEHGGPAAHRLLPPARDLLRRPPFALR
jgi:hypothetical protein